MFYTFLTTLTRFVFKIYFKKLYIHGAERIPMDKPVILACNHPSAFMEACLLACFLPRHLHFLTRGDMFRGRLMKWLLRNTNQIPIYRFRDGFENLRSNLTTFQACYEKLAERKMILIFSEAKTELEKRMRPIQRGTAKLALGALDYDPSMDLCIVPVSVSYEDPRKPGTIVSFHISPPLELHNIDGKTGGEQKEIIRRITHYISDKIGNNMVQIRDKDKEETNELLLDVHRNDAAISIFPFLERSDEFLRHEIIIADAVNDLPPDQYQELKYHTDHYRIALEKAGLDDRVVGDYENLSWAEMLLVIPEVLLYVPGKLCNLIPITAYKMLVSPKIKAEPFRGPVKMILGFFFGAAFYTILLVILMIAIGLVAGLYYGILAAILGIYAIKQEAWILSALGRWRMLFFSSAVREELLSLRNNIQKEISELQIVQNEKVRNNI